MADPPIVSQQEWLAARKKLLAREKEFTRQSDALNAERRGLPMTEVDKRYLFEGGNGDPSLVELFESAVRLAPPPRQVQHLARTDLQLALNR